MRLGNTHCVPYKGSMLDIFKKLLDDESAAAQTNNSPYAEITNNIK
jgi:hypothetical protein